jgi:ABC-type transport system involved in multi-copper enzyme maturation permease subunit
MPDDSFFGFASIPGKPFRWRLRNKQAGGAECRLGLTSIVVPSPHKHRFLNSIFPTMVSDMAVGAFSMNGFPDLASPILGQMTWLPSFLTPIWVIAVGLLIGFAAALVVYGLLSILSFIPPLGRLADSPRRGITASLIVGGIFSALLCWQYVPNAPDSEFAYLLYMPLITIGVICGFGLIYGMWHRTRSEWSLLPSEGVVPYLLSVAGVFVVIGLASTPMVQNPMEFFRAIPAINWVGDGTTSISIPVAGVNDDDKNLAPFVPANVDYSMRNLSELTIQSDRTILISDSSDPGKFARAPFRINAGEPQVFKASEGARAPIPGDPTLLHIQNREVDPADVRLTFKSVPSIPEVRSMMGIAIAFFLLITSVVAFRQAAPRVWAMALSTAKNEMSQPLYLLLLAIGMFSVILFGFYPFNTLGDDIRLLKDSGVTTIMVLGMLQAVWSAGTSVSEEIEGRTALTVLSKPVSRRSFILGKYAGIMLSVLVMFAIISAVFLIVISYKPIYDARETTRGATTWQQSYSEVMTMIPVIGLYFMETMAIGAVAVALATRLPLLANFITCFVVYIIGNLTSPLVAASEGNNELVGFVGKLIAVAVPNLNSFNVQAAMDAAKPIPAIYLPGAFNYLVCFIIAIWMLSMIFFEDRDLA